MTPKTEKTRLDVLLVQRGLAPSRERAQAMLLAGNVRVNGKRMDKPGIRLATDAQIELAGEAPVFEPRRTETRRRPGRFRRHGARKDLPRRGKFQRRIYRLLASTWSEASLRRRCDDQSTRLEAAERSQSSDHRAECALPEA